MRAILLVSSQIQTAVFERDVKFATELTALQTHLSNNLKTVAETQLVNAPRLLRTPRLQPVWQLFDSASSPRDLRETSALRWKPLRRCLKPELAGQAPAPAAQHAKAPGQLPGQGAPAPGCWGQGPWRTQHAPLRGMRPAQLWRSRPGASCRLRLPCTPATA